MQSLRALIVLLALAIPLAFAAEGKPATVKGYVLDSACAFTKGLEKPISRDCAKACAKGGSPLVILTSDGTIYWPIAESTPSTEQNSKLLPFAGQQAQLQSWLGGKPVALFPSLLAGVLTAALAAAVIRGTAFWLERDDAVYGR